MFVAVSIIASSASQAAPILFDVTGTGGAGVAVSTFDELPGNALAVGAQALINSTPVGQTTAAFDLYYQASVRLLGPGNSPVNTGGTTFTAVARFRETATIIAPGIVQFNLAADQSNSYLNFFAHTGPVANDATGVGFSDDVAGSTLIYSATAANSGSAGFFVNTSNSPINLDQTNTPGFPPASGTGQQTVSGNGSSQILAFTTYYNTNYFRTDPGTSTTIGTTNNLPFTTVAPSAQFQALTPAGSSSTFVGYVGKSIGTLNGSNGNDVQFQADASNPFATVVPEPASVAMTVMGLVGVGGFAARRRRSVQA